MRLLWQRLRLLSAIMRRSEGPIQEQFLPDSNKMFDSMTFTQGISRVGLSAVVDAINSHSSLLFDVLYGQSPSTSYVWQIILGGRSTRSPAFSTQAHQRRINRFISQTKWKINSGRLSASLSPFCWQSITHTGPIDRRMIGLSSYVCRV